MEDGAVFRFNDLPLELRNRIYTLALHDSTDVLLASSDENPSVPIQDWYYTGHPTPRLDVRLLRVSRKVHTEAVSILYGTNTFDIQYGKGDVLLLGFLKVIGDSRKHLRRFRFDVFFNSSKMRSALHLLKQAKRVESFACSRHMVGLLKERPSRIKALVPWLATLEYRSQTIEGHKSAFDIFTIRWPDTRRRTRWFYPAGHLAEHSLVDTPINDADRKVVDDEWRAERAEVFEMIEEALDGKV